MAYYGNTNKYKLDFNKYGISYTHSDAYKAYVKQQEEYAKQYAANTKEYYTKALGFLPIDTRYLSNTTNSLAYNSMADVLLNGDAQHERWKGTWLDPKNNNLNIINWLPRWIADTALLGKDTIIDPVVQGVIDDGWEGLGRGFSTATMNTLINLGNTLDIVANPVKGAVIEGFTPGGMSAWDGFWEGFNGNGGFNDTTPGRKQYDYSDIINTGSGVADFGLSLVLEVVSDPLNWITLGGKAAVSGGAKAIGNTATDTIRATLNTALDAGLKNVDELVEPLTTGAKYLSKETATSLLKQMADSSGVVSKAAMNSVMDNVGTGLTKSLTRLGLKNASVDDIADLATKLSQSKMSRLKAGMLDVKPVKLTGASQMAVSDYLRRSVTDMPELLAANRNAWYSLGVRARAVSDSAQKTLFQLAGLQGFDAFIGGCKLIKHVNDAVKGRHAVDAVNSGAIVRTIDELASEMRIDVDSLDKTIYSGVSESAFKTLSGADHDTVIRGLNELKDKFSAKLIEASDAGTLNLKTYKRLREAVFNEINTLIKDTAKLDTVENLSDYITFFKDLRTLSKTEVSVLDDIIRQLETYQNLFTKMIDTYGFKEVKQTLRYYKNAINDVYTETQNSNIIKGLSDTADIQSKLKAIRTAEQETLGVLQDQAARIAVRDAQIEDGLAYITTNHQAVEDSIKTIELTFKTIPETGTEYVSFMSDYSAYTRAYQMYFDTLHDGTKTASDILKSQTDLIDAYNVLEQSYQANVLSKLRQAASSLQDAAQLADNKDLTQFINSMRTLKVDAVDELVNLEDYINGQLISYTLMTNQTRYLTDLVGLTLDGSEKTLAGPIGTLLSLNRKGQPLYEILHDSSIDPSSVIGQRYRQVREILNRFAQFKRMAEALNEVCVNAKLDLGHRQGLMDALVTELQRTGLSSSSNFNTIAKRMLRAADLYFESHLADKRFAMDAVLQDVAINVFNKQQSGVMKETAKAILDSLGNAHDGAVDVDNWLNLMKISSRSDDEVIKRMGTEFRRISKGKHTIVFDLETTGAKEISNTPYQIAGKVLDSNYNIVEEFNYYIRPDKGVRPLDSVLRKLAPATVAHDSVSLHKWWDSLWEEGSTVLNGPILSTADEGVRVFQDICAKYSDTGFIFAGQNIKGFDLELLAKYAGNDFKEILAKTDVFDSLEYMTSNNHFVIKGDIRELLTDRVALFLQDYTKHNSSFRHTKLFSGTDVEVLQRFSLDVKDEKFIKGTVDRVVKSWYSPPDFNTTKYFTVSKLATEVNPKTYTAAMSAYMEDLVAKGLVNVTGTSNIMKFLNSDTAFDTVRLNAKTATSLELANVFSIDKMDTPIVTRAVAENLTQQARSILNLRIALAPSTTKALLSDAQKFLAILKDNAELAKYEIDLDLNYAKWLYDDADDAMQVATALYYFNQLSDDSVVKSMFFVDQPRVLHFADLDPVTNLPRFIYQDEYYNYNDFIKIIQSDDPFDAVRAYNTEHNLYNAHTAAVHRMQADNAGLANRVESTLRSLSKGSMKLRKHYESAIFKYSDYLDEAAIKEILQRPNRVQAFIDEAKLRAGRVYFETRDAVDLSDFAQTDGVLAKSVELFDEASGKSLGFGNIICLTKETYNKADDIVKNINVVNSIPDLPEELYSLIKENRYHNGLYVKNIGWSHGDVLTKQHINAFDEMLQTKFGVDSSTLIDVQSLTAQDYFATIRANNMIIGGSDVFNRVLGNTDLTYVTDPFKLTFYNTRGPVSSAHTKLAAYANLIFNKENDIASDLFNKFTSKDLAKLSKQNKATMGWYYLETPHIKEGSFISRFFSDQTQSGYVLREIPIINEKSIEIAKKAGAHCLPRAQAGQLMQAFNTFKLPKIAEFARNISSLYKVAYLGSIGMIVRNAIDSNYKTRWALDGTVSLPDQVKHLFSTMKLIKRYDEIGQFYSSVLNKYFTTDLDYEIFYKVVQNMNDPDVVTKIASDYSDQMTKTVIRKTNEVLESFNKAALRDIADTLIDPDTFSVMDSFIRFGPSAGLSKSVLSNIAATTSESNITTKLISWITEESPMRFVYDWNDMVEQSARLSMFLQDLSRGSNVDSAINNILKTHFDYSDKSLGMLYAEIIFPFMNFSYKNLDFWVEAIYKQPQLAGELENIFRPIMDYHSLYNPDQAAYEAYDYTFDWSKNVMSFEANAPWTQINAARLYHLLNGNLVIDTGRDVKHDAGYKVKTNDLYAVFKLSPSFLDAVKMLYNPLNSYSERLLPPIETVTNIFKDLKSGENITQRMDWASLVGMLPYADVVMQRVGINSEGLKHNNIFTRIKDAGPQMAVASLFGVAYVPQKNNYYFYDSDYNVLGGFKQNYYGKRNYTNPYYTRNPNYTITRMAQNKKPKSIYAPTKASQIRKQHLDYTQRNAVDRILRARIKDYSYYY